MEHAHAVVANTVAALKACGDKYGDDLHDWLSTVVDGQRPTRVPRLDQRGRSAAVCKRRQLARETAMAFKDFVHARWLALTLLPG